MLRSTTFNALLKGTHNIPIIFFLGLTTGCGLNVKKSVDDQFAGTFRMDCTGDLPESVAGTTFVHQFSRLVGGSYLSETNIKRQTREKLYDVGFGASTSSTAVVTAFTGSLVEAYRFESDATNLTLTVTAPPKPKTSPATIIQNSLPPGAASAAFPQSTAANDHGSETKTLDPFVFDCTITHFDDN